MQFKVPQNVQREDTIIGPLTLKQMIICAIGGTIAYGIFVSLGKYYMWITWLPPVALVTLVTLAFAFVRPLDLSFTKYSLLFIEFSLLPKKRIWVKGSAESLTPPETAQQKAKAVAKKESETEELEEKQRKMQELQKFLDAQKTQK